MITVTLNRKTRRGKAIRGYLTLPLEQGQRTFDTLENAEFLIPAGTYPLRLTWSPRFKKNMPLIDEVPDREGIRIHMGTKPEHSEGCVLLSYEALTNLIVLFNQRKKWYEESEMQITIVDGFDAPRV